MQSCIEFIKENLYSKKEELKDNFKTIKEAIETSALAIDGGSSIINDGGSWLIAKLKIASTYYEKGKRMPKKESLKNYYMSLINNKGAYSQKLSPDIKLSSDYKSIRELSEAPAIVMKSLEFSHALEKIDELKKDSIILIDGLLKGDSSDQEKILELLKNKASKKGIHIIGLAKTCRYGLGGRSVIGTMLRAKPNHKWLYHPISDENVFIVKLHEKSAYAYMLNAFPHSKTSIEKIISALCFYSRDPELLGYPYPLLRVDKVARIGEHEKKQEESRLKIISKKTGYDFLETDKRATDMHSRLDKRAYR
jgi:NurA-like 5'-3' nuclease